MNNITSVIILGWFALSCSDIQTELAQNVNINRLEFYANFEGSIPTRVYLDSLSKPLWNEFDSISVFSSTYNQKYVFTGNNGDNSGTFRIIQDEAFVTGNCISTNYAVSPFNPNTSIDNSEKIWLSLPNIQKFQTNSYGKDANTMIAVTNGLSDRFLAFKNVGGYLVLKLYGNCIVKKIVLKGNNSEKISGSGIVSMQYDSEPTIKLDEKSFDYITLNCEDGIVLTNDINKPIEFWFVIPPTTFSKGFKVEIFDDKGYYMEQSTNQSYTIKRNVINKMEPLKVQCSNQSKYIIFSDYQFEKYCISNFDLNHDGMISLIEASSIDSVKCNNQNIQSIFPIEKFVNLRYLNISDNNILSLDLSCNPKVETLICDNNKIVNINLKNNYWLKHLSCQNNQLTSVALARGLVSSKTDPNVNVSYFPFKGPIITLIDDDFNINYVPRLKALCDSLNIKCDFALMPFGTDDHLYFTDKQQQLINNFVNDGYGILLHPRHEYWYTDNVAYKFVDIEHVEYSLTNTIQLFNNYNLCMETKCLVYPGNSNEPGVRDMCKKYVHFGIGTSGNYNIDLSKPFDLERLMINFSTKGKLELKKAIDKGIEKKAWIILGIHCWQFHDETTLDNNTFSWANLRDLLEYAHAKCEFETFDKVISF